MQSQQHFLAYAINFPGGRSFQHVMMFPKQFLYLSKAIAVIVTTLFGKKGKLMQEEKKI